MAKLKARGRTEIARYEAETPDGRKRSYAVMSDGWVLFKGQYRYDGRLQPATWKRSFQLAKGETPRKTILAMQDDPALQGEIHRADLVDVVCRKGKPDPGNRAG